MIISTKNKALIIVAVCSLHCVTEAIQNSTADICTAVVAVACVGGSAKIIHDTPSYVAPSTLAMASFVATGAIYWFAHRSTPAGRLKRANVLLDELCRHKLARVSFDNDGDFFDTVQDVYLTDDLPLISAYNHLIGLIPTMHYAFGLINKAAAEVGKDSLLQEECDSSSSRANMLFRNISDAVKRIREHKDYLPQLTLYKESLHNEKQTIAQEQIALAHTQMARTKWIKAIFGK